VARALSPNQIVAWNLRRLRQEAGLSQPRLAELASHHGLPWTAFTVSDAELSADPARKGRRFTPDELVVLATLFSVTPTALLVPPRPEDAGDQVAVQVGAVTMTREEYLTEVLLVPVGVRARPIDLAGVEV
jgi:hypothetical protein